jgi:hypothetical protein
MVPPPPRTSIGPTLLVCGGPRSHAPTHVGLQASDINGVGFASHIAQNSIHILLAHQRRGGVTDTDGSELPVLRGGDELQHHAPLRRHHRPRGGHRCQGRVVPRRRPQR